MEEPTLIIRAGDCLQFDPPKKLMGRHFTKLEVEGVFDPSHSVHPGEPRVIGMGTPLRGRRRIRLNVLATEIVESASVSAVPM